MARTILEYFEKGLKFRLKFVIEINYLQLVLDENLINTDFYFH